MMPTSEIASSTKTEKIDEAIRLATRMQEQAIAHAVRVANGAPEYLIAAAFDRWTEAKDDLRSFLAMALPGEVQ